MGKKLVLILCSILVPCTALLLAEEYWRGYIHPSDAENFEAPPMMFGEMNREEARLSGNYTIVERDGSGNILEAMTMLRSKPNYYFVYYYDEAGSLRLYEMRAFTGEQEILISRVSYTYNPDGRLQSSACYSFNPLNGEGSLRYLKEYTGSAYRLFDYTPSKPDPETQRKLDEVNRNLEELIRLESRGAIRKLLGIR